MGLLPRFSELNLHDKETAQGSSVPGHRATARRDSDKFPAAAVVAAVMQMGMKMSSE